MNRALLSVCVALSFAACTAIGPPVAACVSDNDCDVGSLCFAEGCGDPGKGIVVEVEGPAMSVYRARDFALGDGTLGATFDFPLGQALAISGQLQRELSSGNPADRTSYTEGVVVRAVGTSTLLPGVTRSFETRFDKPEFGFYEMNIGAGSFTVTATPANPAVPPVSSMTTVGASTIAPSVSFAFPAVEGTPALTGRLIRRVDAAMEPLLISQAFDGGVAPVVELQVFDPITNQPLSQRFPIGNTSGEFAMSVSPEARAHPKLLFVAAPREPGTPIPTKRFLIETPLPPALALEYGDYGQAGDLISQIVDQRSMPVVGAHVVIEGVVGGDGTFRSKIVQTDGQGEFRLTTLPSRANGTFQITVVPPETSEAAYTRRSVSVTVRDGVVRMDPERIVLEDRIQVRGTVFQAGGESVAKGVAVRAILQPEKATSTLAGEVRSLPVEPAQAFTDQDGVFSLRLDPGTWRFEYMAGGQTPMASRLLTVTKPLDDKGNELPVLDVKDVILPNGRTVSGVVTGTRGNQSDVGLGFSQLRFFRVTSIEGKPVSVLLGTSIADENGRYNVVLPTVMSTSLTTRNANP